MERKFVGWGKVVDVYISNKRNKSERFFGFVRFAGVNNQIWLESQLKDIWFESYKTWVNISKFARKISYETKEMTARQAKAHFRPLVEQSNKENKNEQ